MIRRMRHVLIIGGGVIGLTTAFSLRQRGVPQVTVLDGAPAPHGASVVNAGWITPSHSEPVGVPGMTRQALRWMLRSDSPLYIKPAVTDLHLMRWLFRFWRCLSEERYSHATASLVALNDRTFPLFASYAEAGVPVALEEKGRLVAFLSGRHLEAKLRHAEGFRRFGFAEPRAVWGREARDLEPALSTNVAGVVQISGDRHLEPEGFLQGLVDWLRAQQVVVAYNNSVLSLDIDGGRIRAVEATGGRYEADAVVIAAGAYSGRLARMAGSALPIQAGKGYKIDYHQPPVSPAYPLGLHEPRMAVTPMGSFTRLAGTMEISGINSVVRRERVEALARGGAQFLRDWPREIPEETIGSGLRPMTPDGMPIIGALPKVRNGFISTGHQMLGLTLAPASADALAELVTTGLVPPVLEPFSAGRF
jgi:D-amino-acid dehydrogenase